EMRESTKIVGQVIESLPEGPVMVEDRKIAWPAQLALGEGGLGNAPEYIRKIMGESMEALIHHFKLVTEGFKVPAGEVDVPPEEQSRSALLPMLYLAQAEQGYVSPTAMREIGDLLGLTRAQVGAVATFYTMFKRDPQGKWLISVCTHPSCALAGGQQLKERLE